MINPYFFGRLRPLAILLAITLLPLPKTSVQAQARYDIGTDTPVPVRLLSAISSETDTSVRVLSQAQAVVDRDVVSPDGRVLIAANTPVTMQASRQRSRGLGRPG